MNPFMRSATRCSLSGHPSVALWGAFAETHKDGRWVWQHYESFTKDDAAAQDRALAVIHGHVVDM